MVRSEKAEQSDEELHAWADDENGVEIEISASVVEGGMLTRALAAPVPCGK
jgi:hypothetical protein